MSTAERVLAVLANVTETDEVRQDPTVHLYDLDLLDSLRTVELLVALSDEFGVDISPAEVERDQWASPRQVIKYMEQRVGT